MDNRVNLVFLSIYWPLKHTGGGVFLQKNCVLRHKNQTFKEHLLSKVQLKT